MLYIPSWLLFLKSGKIPHFCHYCVIEISLADPVLHKNEKIRNSLAYLREELRWYIKHLQLEDFYYLNNKIISLNSNANDNYNNNKNKNMSLDLRNMIPFHGIQRAACDNFCIQDYFGRTILHVIIEQNDDVLLQLFGRLYQQQTEYGYKNVQLMDELKNLLKIYDDQGYTILHKAIKYNKLAFVKDILEFCEYFQVNVADYELLGTGDSILHLAVKHNLKDMSELILSYIPTLANVKNYPGDLPIYSMDPCCDM